MCFKTIVATPLGTLLVAVAITMSAVQCSHTSARSAHEVAPGSTAAAQANKRWEPVCKPVSERTGELGCWITAHVQLDLLPQQPMFWHLDTYPTRAAAEAARGLRGTVVESLGKVWLFTIDEAEWRPASGERVGKVGPLPVSAETRYSAQYMEAIFTPGMTAPAHRHSGPEAWYTLSGETCLETPEGKMVGRAGGAHVIVPEGPPMHLTATGKETRRALVLIFHDSSKAPTTPAHDWTPKGLCKQ
jgi:quercetin dioxygenase-like cupin family protein